MARRAHPQGYATPEAGLRVLLNSEGGCVDTSKACRLFVGASPTGAKGLRARIRRGDIIAYKTKGGRYLIPRWQFDSNGNIILGLTEILRAMRAKIPGYGQLSPFVFFLQVDPVTNGLTPLDALRAGDLERTLRAVEARIH
jgi:hypothetical protein